MHVFLIKTTAILTVSITLLYYQRLNNHGDKKFAECETYSTILLRILVEPYIY